MKFTDRFLELPMQYLDEEEGCIQSFVKFNIYEVSSYVPYHEDEMTIPDGTEVTLKTGDAYNIPLTVDKFEEELNMAHAINCRQ